MRFVPRDVSTAATAATAPVVCFLDESATDANDSDFAVLGGLVMNRKDIAEFEAAWTAMLAKHRLAALHMIDLGPGGPYPDVIGDACSALLVDAVRAVNTCRIFSFGASWNNRAHEALFSSNMRKRFFSVYCLGFLMVVEINRASAAHQGYDNVIDYVLDDGNRFKRQVRQMYNSIRALPELSNHKVGSLTFETDSKVLALQAADVVAWATRREFSGKGLTGVYEPLRGLFDQSYVHSPAPTNLIEVMSARFAVAEANVDPDSVLGWLILKRRVIFWALLTAAAGVAASSVWFGPVFVWAAFGLIAAVLIGDVALARRLRKR